jgi:hypothetical protein
LPFFHKNYDFLLKNNKNYRFFSQKCPHFSIKIVILITFLLFVKNMFHFVKIFAVSIIENGQQQGNAVVVKRKK